MAATITVEKLNEVHCRVLCDDGGVEAEIVDFFTYDYPGAKFTPRYRARLWDGKIYLYDPIRKTLYVGLLPYLQKFAEDGGHEIKLIGDLSDDSDIDYEEVVNFVSNLTPSSKGTAIEAREYQLDAIHFGLRARRAMLLSPTGSGKSLIIYSLCRWHVSKGRRVLLITPSTSLVEQMYADFTDYSLNNGWDVSATCQRLYSGMPKDLQCEVLISTWQSLHRHPKEWFQQFDVVIGDEAHLHKAKSLTSMLEKMTHIQYRIGTTGSLDNSKCLAGNTLIDTQKGPMPIQNLVPGDLVKSLNEMTMLTEYRPVVRVLNNGRPSKMIRIKTTNGILEVTPDHKIMTTGGWIEAKHLRVGSEIIYIS